MHKEIKLQNLNNCLACDAFVQIHFAPDRQIAERELATVFLLKHEGQDILVKLVDMLRVDFDKVTSIMTLPATGMEFYEWRLWWMKQHPKTSMDSKMCVYYYKKEK